MSLMFAPLFHYDQQRNYDIIYKAASRNEDVAWFLKEYAGDLTRNAADYRTVKKNLYFAESTVTYAMNITKEERN